MGSKRLPSSVSNIQTRLHGSKTIKMILNQKRIPFAIMTDETQFSGSSVMLKYAEKREELSLKKCMRKCFRYAGCVAFNFYEYEEYDVCELHSKMSEPVQNKETNVKVWVLFYSSLFQKWILKSKLAKIFNPYFIKTVIKLLSTLKLLSFLPLISKPHSENM